MPPKVGRVFCYSGKECFKIEAVSWRDIFALEDLFEVCYIEGAVADKGHVHIDGFR